jgi:hypothetical protein
MYGLWVRRMTAGLDEVRETKGSSHLRALNAVRKTASLVSGFRPMGSSSVAAPCTLPALNQSIVLAGRNHHSEATAVIASVSGHR